MKSRFHSFLHYIENKSKTGHVGQIMRFIGWFFAKECLTVPDVDEKRMKMIQVDEPEEVAADEKQKIPEN